MAETAGLVVGIFGLASLIRDCIKLYTTLGRSKHYGVDFESLLVEIEVEGSRLCLWGEGVGLFKPADNAVDNDALTDVQGRIPEIAEERGVHERLKDRRVVHLVFKVLSHAKQVLEETDKLRTKYGPLRQDANKALTFDDVSMEVKLAQDERQKNGGIKAKAVWSFSDRSKFRKYLHKLRQFNDSLNSLVPSSTPIKRLNEQEPTSVNIPNRVMELEVAEDSYDSNTYTATLSGTELQQSEIPSSTLNPQGRNLVMGSICVNITGEAGKPPSLSISWIGVTGEEEARWKRQLLLPHSSIATVGDICQRISLIEGMMYVDDQNVSSIDFTSLDIEASWTWEGATAGTVSLEGYINYINFHSKSNLTHTQTVSIQRIPFPHTKKALHRLEILKQQGLGERTDEQLFKDLTTLLGAPPSNTKVENQILAICAQLNRPSFCNFLGTNSVALASHSVSEGKFNKFIYQILLGYELRLRLLTLKTPMQDYITPKLLANMLISALWTQNVLCLPTTGTLTFHSRVHSAQIDTLIRFARQLDWPHLEQTQQYISTLYSLLLNGGKVSPDVWDWIFGLVLPGRYFASKIMTTMVLCTPAIADMGPAPHLDCGLVLGEVSYWRATTVMGRVLGALTGVTCIGGWIGPCPRPFGVDGNGWVRISSRPVEVPQLLFTGKRVEEPLDPRVEIGDWQIIEPPPRSQGCWKVRQIELKNLLPSLPGHQRIWDKDKEYQASIIFCNGVTTIEYPLYTNPLYISAYPCVNGQHKANLRLEDQDLKRCWNVPLLSEVPGNYNGMIIINATGEGEEAVARAWCANMGKHSVIRKGAAACFACAVKLASDRGIHTNVLILS